MTQQSNIFDCRECNESFSEESNAYEGFTCEECTNDLNDNINQYDTVESVIRSLSTDLIISELVNHDLDDTPIKDLILIYKNLVSYIKEHYEECKGDYLETGHKDEDYRDFLIYPYFDNLRNEGIESLKTKLRSGKYETDKKSIFETSDKVRVYETEQGSFYIIKFLDSNKSLVALFYNQSFTQYEYLGLHLKPQVINVLNLKNLKRKVDFIPKTLDDGLIKLMNEVY